MSAADRILQLMERDGVSAVKLQKDLGLNANAVFYWKTGRQKPSAETLSKLADYFGVSVDYLLERTDNPQFDALVIPPILRDPAVRAAFHEGLADLTQRDIDELARVAELLAAKNREKKP